MTEILIGMVAGVAAMTFGCFVGAWLTYRRHVKASPMPSIFRMPGHVQEEDHTEKVPEDKRVTV